MNKKEKDAIKYLEFLSNEKCECEACQRAKKEYKTILNLLDKQQKEIEDLKVIADDIKDHRIVYVDTPEFEEKYISKDKIREKMQEIMSYAYTSAEERHCQNYAYDRLKELLEE